MTDKDRLADIQTSLAVLASNSTTQSSQIDEMKRSLEKATEHEAKLFDKVFAKTEAIEKRMAGAEGSIKGARWAFGAVLSVLTAVAAFIGLS